MDPSLLERVTRELALRKRLQEALLAFSKGVSAQLSVGTALETLAAEVNELFGAASTSIWLHDRRTHALILAGSSDSRRSAITESIPTADDSAIARGLRQESVQVTGAGARRVLVAPLRGWRRALGTLVIEGQAREVDDEAVVELSADLARQLSIAVESVVVLEELIRQRRILEDTFDSLADMVLVTDAEHRVVQINDALVLRVGMARTDLLGRPADDVVGKPIAEWAAAHEVTGSGSTREFRGERLADAIAATVTALVSGPGAPAGRVLVLRDITEQHELRARLSQSEKLASLGQFIAGIAHEMNNPLQSVLGHLELMMESPEQAAHRAALRRIYFDAERVAKIVNNLLVFGGSQRASRKPVDVDGLIARVIEIRRSALTKTYVPIFRAGGESLPDVLGDVELLQRALLNVVLNAEQAIAESGNPGDITITSAAEAGCVTITVEDTGPGIPPEVLSRIFDPFFTTKEVGKGTGLGLAIAFGILHEHGGSIEATSGPAGARFTIILPAALADLRT